MRAASIHTGRSVFDPVGMVMLRSIARYWTVSEQNTLWMPFRGMFLWNRVVWCSVGVAALLATYIFLSHVGRGADWPQQQETEEDRAGVHRAARAAIS